MPGTAGSTFAESSSAIRTLLDDPAPQNPNPRVILEHYKAEAQLLLNQAQNSSINWAVRSYLLQTADGQDPYLITAADFGKDVLVHTVDDTNPYHVERTIPRTTLQSREAEYFGPKKLNSASTYHTAEVIIFYREDNAVYASIRPVPSGSVSYKIWYEVSLVTDGVIVLGSTPILPISHPYLQLRVARALLPYCKWTDLDWNLMREKKQELALSFSASIDEQRDAFRRYLATDRQQGVTPRRGFDDEEYSADYINPYML